MNRATPLKRTPFQRKNNTENIPSNVDGTSMDAAHVAIKYIVKMPAKSTVSAPAAAPAFRGSFPKSQPVRNEAYRRLVAALPCVICGIAGYSQAAHGSAGKGIGIKACDSTLFPACAPRPGVAGCHAQLDQHALFTKTVRHQLEPAWAADTQRKIHAMGKWPKGIPYPHQQEQA